MSQYMNGLWKWGIQAAAYYGARTVDTSDMFKQKCYHRSLPKPKQCFIKPSTVLTICILQKVLEFTHGFETFLQKKPIPNLADILDKYSAVLFRKQ